jgi:ATP-binding cassette subfamily F protein 3
MALLECRELYKDYSGTVVLESVSLAIHAGDKVALVGANGAGKTTLLNLLTGRDDDYKGTIARSGDLRLGYLSQHVEPPGDGSALEYLLEDAQAAEARVRRAECSLAEAGEREMPRALSEYQKAIEAYEAFGADFAEERASRAMALVGLGGKERTPARALSGGERGILALAKALQSRPNLLVLDEPGNHLDFWGMAWLEDFIAGLGEAVLIVSHNRMLLDRCVKRVIELEQGASKEYGGDYSTYRLEKLRNAATQGEDWQASKKKIARLQEMVNRYASMAIGHSNWAGAMYGQRLRARRHQLEREKAAATERPDLASSAITAAFSGRGAADVKSDYALIVKDYSRAFGERPLYRNAGFDVLVGERVALVGPNGCGKTTFLRDMVDSGSWEHPHLRLCPSMRVGYVAQDRDGFTRGRTVREEFWELGARENDVRALLRDFGFGRGDPDRMIDTLSGGELNRLQLARAIWSKANFLVLDEPTNHLDLDAREAVEDRLAEYDGTILVVSHDRYFLEKVATRIVYVRECAFEPFEGTFTEFWRSTGASLAPGAVKVASGAEDRAHAMERARKARAATADSGETLERRIVELETGKESLERRIKAAFDKREFRLARKLSNELEELHQDIERLYARWA